MKKILIKLGFPILKLYWFIFRPETQGVKCVVIHNGKIVLVRHSYGSQLWALPGGGIHHGESVQETVIREMREELGLSVHKIKEIGEFINTAEHKIDHIHYCIANTHTIEITIDGIELIEAKWFDVNDFPQEISPLSATLFTLCLPYLKDKLK